MPDTVAIDEFHDVVLVTMIDDFKRADLTPALDKIADGIAEQTRENFLNESSPGGEKWAELSPATVAKKGHDVILVDSTNMRKSVVLRDAAGHIERIEDDSIEYGTNIVYAVVHQEGTGRIPQREFLGFNEQSADAVAEIVADHYVETLKQ